MVSGVQCHSLCGTCFWWSRSLVVRGSVCSLVTISNVSCVLDTNCGQKHGDQTVSLCVGNAVLTPPKKFSTPPPPQI